MCGPTHQGGVPELQERTEHYLLLQQGLGLGPGLGLGLGLERLGLGLRLYTF